MTADDDIYFSDDDGHWWKGMGFNRHLVGRVVVDSAGAAYAISSHYDTPRLTM